MARRVSVFLEDREMSCATAGAASTIITIDSETTGIAAVRRKQIL